MYNQCWLVNFRSGNREGERLAAALAAQVRVIELDFSRLDEQLREAGGYARIVVVGGDGTFASVLSASSVPVAPVGLVPIGTANDLARELGMMRLCSRHRYEELPSIFEHLSVRKLATWELTADGRARGFCNYVSLGFEGEVVRDFDRWRSRARVHNRLMNRVMYSLFGFRHWFKRVPSAKVTSNDGSEVTCRPTRGLIISNVRSHMGIGIVTRASDSSDDVIECIRASSPIDYLRMVASKLYLLPSLLPLKRGRSLVVSGLPSGVAIQVDGEPHAPLAGDRIEVRFKRFVNVLVAERRVS